MAHKPVTPKEAKKVVALYNKLQSVWKVGDLLNRNGQWVFDVVKKYGTLNKMNVFTKEHDEYLLIHYNKYVEDGKLQDLANSMGRTKQFLCRQAKRLGLTDMKRKDHPDVCLVKGIRAAKYIKENGHPRGMLGKKHSAKFCADRSRDFKLAWKDPNHYFNSEELRQQRSDIMSAWQTNNKNKSNNYSRTKKGWFVKGDLIIPMRSSWEFNYAHYLNHIQSQGQIVSWEYEVDRFKFDEIYVSPRTYTPDFKITMPDGQIIYHEVKGWMDEKSKLKLKYMSQYYPDIKIILIDKKVYQSIEKKKELIPNWGIYIKHKP